MSEQNDTDNLGVKIETALTCFEKMKKKCFEMDIFIFTASVFGIPWQNVYIFS